MTTRNGTGNGRVTPKKPLAAASPLPPPVPCAPDGKLRLLKVVLQPVFVLVGDGGDVQEVAHPAVEVKGVDWAKWSAEAFTEGALDALRQQIVPASPEVG